MKLSQCLGRAAALAATSLSVLSPGLAFAEQPAHVTAAAGRVQPTTPSQSTSPSPAQTITAAFNVSDVALDAQHALRGQALTPQGQPISNQPIVLDDGVTQVAGTTDAQGGFQFTNVRGGTYRVQVAGNTQFLRAWSATAAPPNASQGVMVVGGGTTLLAQYCGNPVTCGSPVRSGFGGFRETLKNPLVVGGIVAAAIAIPVALANTDDDDPAS
jgi:hypothetical protein